MLQQIFDRVPKREQKSHKFKSKIWYVKPIRIFPNFLCREMATQQLTLYHVETANLIAVTFVGTRVYLCREGAIKLERRD